MSSFPSTRPVEWQDCRDGALRIGILAAIFLVPAALLTWQEKRLIQWLRPSFDPQGDLYGTIDLIRGLLYASGAVCLIIVVIICFQWRSATTALFKARAIQAAISECPDLPQEWVSSMVVKRLSWHSMCRNAGAAMVCAALAFASLTRLRFFSHAPPLPDVLGLLVLAIPVFGIRFLIGVFRFIDAARGFPSKGEIRD